MMKNYLEKVYSGWLAKLAGIRLGAPIEARLSEYSTIIFESIKESRF